MIIIVKLCASDVIRCYIWFLPCATLFCTSIMSCTWHTAVSVFSVFFFLFFFLIIRKFTKDAREKVEMRSK